MGNIISSSCCHSEVSTYAVLDVEGVSCETMWQTRFDAENFPSITHNILQAEMIHPGDETNHSVGKKWKETRLYAGREKTMVATLITVTGSGSDENPNECYRCGTYSVSFDDTQWDTRQGNQTGSFAVYPLPENRSGCRVVFTVNFASDGIRGASLKCFGHCVTRYAKSYIRSELEDYVAVAVQRERTRKGT
jgi:hypothetical protein